LALQTAEHQKSAIAKFLNAVATGKVAEAEMGVVATKLADIAVTLGLTGAMGPLLVVTLALGAAMIALTLGISGIVALFKKLKDATPEG
jgi:NhaP-type Na+/H+ or K+/H+ antiporter